jgi:paraquat-inducible protein A
MTSTTLAGAPDPAGPNAAREAARADELIACTVCDALHRLGEVPEGSRLRCARCGSVLLRSEHASLDNILGSAFAMVVLVGSAVFLPFLQISARGFKSNATLLDTAFAFAGGITTPLAALLVLLIVVIPISRAVLVAYALLPMRLGLRLLPWARRAFYWSGRLRPWSMAEVFIIGVVVALVKIGGMATVSFGPAFWELSIIAVIVALEAASLSEQTIWRMLEQHQTS